jgi:TRAP-type transport system periplasmic protein
MIAWRTAANVRIEPLASATDGEKIMRLGRRALLASIAASIAAPAILRRAAADAPIALKLHHSFSAVSGAHERFLVPWARKVESEAQGRIRVDIFPSMQLGGSPARLYDQVRDGVTDLAWLLPSNTPGRFAKIEVFELPFVPSRRALVNSRALQDYAAANLADEFADVRPICFSCRDHGIVHAKRAIKTIADLKGLRLHVPHRIARETIHALGGQGISIPSAQLPMAIAGHVIDGCLDPWDLVPSLRLDNLLKEHTDFAESSLSTATFVLAMNKATYERLPGELKTVIDANSGQAAAGMAGTMWDLEARAVADLVGGRGDPINVLSAEDVVAWRKATEPVIGLWLKEMRGRKIEGDELIAAANTLVAKYADEPEPQPPKPATPEANSTAQPPQATTEPPEVPKADAVATSPQAKVETPQLPKVEMPAVKPPAKPAPPKELDIPL